MNKLNKNQTRKLDQRYVDNLAFVDNLSIGSIVKFKLEKPMSKEGDKKWAHRRLILVDEIAMFLGWGYPGAWKGVVAMRLLYKQQNWITMFDLNYGSINKWLEVL